MKNRCKNQWEIWMGFCMALGAFLVDFGGVFGTLGPWFWVFRVGETRFFKISFFFMFGLIFLWFWEVLGWFWGSFWGPKGDQNGFKIWSKKWVIFGSLLEALWGAKGRVDDPKGWRQRSTGRSPPYCRVNPSGQVVRNSRVWARLAFFMSFYVLLCPPFFTTFWGNFGIDVQLILHLKSLPFFTMPFQHILH